MAKTRSATANDEVPLDLATLTTRFLQSESSHREMNNHLNQLEHQMGAKAHQLATNTQQLNANTQQLNANAQQLNEITRILKEQFGNSTPEVHEASNLGPIPTTRVPVNNTRREGNPQIGINNEQEDPRRVENRQDNRQFDQGNQRCYLPRLDFPSFDGTNPTVWVEGCELYLDMYQTPEIYKSRMAAMHFTDQAQDWYKCFKITNPQPPWLVLVEEVMDFFSDNTSNPVDEFKRVHQTRRVDDYVKSFWQAKARLTYKKKINSEDF